MGKPVAGEDDGAVARPRFWGPASFWRLGLVVLAVLIAALLIARLS